MDNQLKKRRTNLYGRYMHKVDRNMVEITPYLKYKHMMEIVDYAHKLLAQDDRPTRLKVKKNGRLEKKI